MLLRACHRVARRWATTDAPTPTCAPLTPPPTPSPTTTTSSSAAAAAAAARPRAPLSAGERGAGADRRPSRPHQAGTRDRRRDSPRDDGRKQHLRRTPPTERPPVQTPKPDPFTTRPTGWDALRGQERGQMAWEDRPMPVIHSWRPAEPEHDPRSQPQRKAASHGAWTGRREDEVRMLSSWKGPGGPWTWRVVDSEVLLDNDGFDATRIAQSKPWSCAMAGALLKTGFHEWEVRFTGNTRAVRVGVALPETGVHDNLAWGPQSAHAWVVSDLGSLWHNEKLVGRCRPFRHSGDVVTLYCDMDTGTLRVAVNGKKQPDAEFHFLPATGVQPIVCFRELPVTAEMRHVLSTKPAEDAGPFQNGVAVTRGQILSIPKELPLQFHKPPQSSGRRT